MTKELQILGDRVAVELDPREEERGGILIPDKARQVSVVGTVQACGPETRDTEPGERVYVPKSAGTKFIVGGMEMVLLREGQILAKIGGNNGAD